MEERTSLVSRDIFLAEELVSRDIFLAEELEIEKKKILDLFAKQNDIEDDKSISKEERKRKYDELHIMIRKAVNEPINKFLISRLGYDPKKNHKIKTVMNYNIDKGNFISKIACAYLLKLVEESYIMIKLCIELYGSSRIGFNHIGYRFKDWKLIYSLGHELPGDFSILIPKIEKSLEIDNILKQLLFADIIPIMNEYIELS